MKFAENWVKEKNEKELGLHVNIESEDALKLYEDLNYEIYKTQFIKKIDNSSLSLGSKGYERKNLRFKQVSNADDLDSIKNLVYKAFNKKLRCTVGQEQIGIKFNEYIKILKSNEEDFKIFKLIEVNDQVCGFFILYVSEWRYNECVWIRDIGFSKNIQEIQLFNEIYNFIAKWALNQDISFIEIVLTKKQSKLLNSVVRSGFSCFGFFMEKKLN
jgi:hypothetical protein